MWDGLFGKSRRGYYQQVDDENVFNEANRAHAERMQRIAYEEFEREMKQQQNAFGQPMNFEEAVSALEDDNERLRKQNKKLMERIAYYEKKD